MVESVNLTNGYIDANNLEIDGLYRVCKELQDTSARTGKEKIISENKNYEDFKELLLFLCDNSITTGLDIKKIHKQTNTCGYYTCATEILCKIYEAGYTLRPIRRYEKFPTGGGTDIFDTVYCYREVNV